MADPQGVRPLLCPRNGREVAIHHLPHDLAGVCWSLVWLVVVPLLGRSRCGGVLAANLRLRLTPAPSNGTSGGVRGQEKQRAQSEQQPILPTLSKKGTMCRSRQSAQMISRDLCRRKIKNTHCFFPSSTLQVITFAITLKAYRNYEHIHFSHSFPTP